MELTVDDQSQPIAEVPPHSPSPPPQPDPMPAAVAKSGGDVPLDPHLNPHGHYGHGHHAQLNPAHAKFHADHAEFHRVHKGHENQHAIMLLILIATLVLSQIGLVAWKKRHFKSYQYCSLIGLLTVPVAISLYYGWTRFVLIWLVYCILTGWVARVTFKRHISGTTPRFVYSYFYYLHLTSAFVSVFGYMTFFFTLLGVPAVFFNKPERFADAGLMIMFYGLYYGVVGRDLADWTTDRLASHIGYYSKDGLPRLKLGQNVCAACGNRVRSDFDDDNSVLSPMLDSGRPQGVAALNDFGHRTAESSWPTHAGDERVIVLNCKHVFHEFCLRGWCIVGKKEICPYCKERFSLSKVFKNPWQRPHVLFGQMIDLIRYFVVWQPLLFGIVKGIIYIIGLE